MGIVFISVAVGGAIGIVAVLSMFLALNWIRR